jgi:hypothetical protein
MDNAADVLNTVNAIFGGGSTDGVMTAGTLYISGNFQQTSAVAFAASGTHLTVFNGTGPQTVTFADPGQAASRFQEMAAENSAQVTLPTISGNGAYVSGNLTVRGFADVSPGCERIDVVGNLITTESGTISMTCDDFARIVVEGDASFGGGSTAGQLTLGQLTVRGNFSQSGDPESYAASLTHSTVLSSDGPQAMNVSFANPEPVTGSRFGTLFVQSETSGGNGYVLTLNTPAYVLGNATLDPLGPDIPAQVNGAGELIVNGSIGFGSGSSNIAPAALRVGGALNLTAGVTYGAGITEFFGSGSQTIPVRDDYFTVIATGDSVNFDGVVTATIGGDLYIAGNGLLDLDSAGVTVLGNLYTQDQGRLRMDVTGFGGLDVNGSVSFGGGNTSTTLTNGTLDVAGDFTQTTGLSAQSFAPGPNHVTVLDGTGAQQVTFESPTLNESRFGDLQIENTSAGGIVLNSAVLVRDDFLTPATPANTATVVGNGNTITTYSIDIDNVTFDNAPLDILYDSDYATYSEADNITLVNMDPTISQIQIDRGSGNFYLRSINFYAPFTTGEWLNLNGPFFTWIVPVDPATPPANAVTLVNGADYCWGAGCA